MRGLELLAPARNVESGIAAIAHGADAVYVGPPMFGARAAAGNSIADIETLCQYAHQYGAKVHATVNTLLHDDELSLADWLLNELADVGVDAVLIQDMRLASHPLFRRGRMALHASTQADNRTADHVKWLADHGFSRAVLARELSIDEIAAIHRAVPQMQLEVFVHGALCVSYSGLCYASEHCFGRSANRGECAQFCRMQFDLLDADGKELIHQRHLLSLRDLNLSQYLPQLIAAGAMSFKIEGRLKDMGYVKNVTAAYSQLLNQFIADQTSKQQHNKSRQQEEYCRTSRGYCSYTFQPDLQRTFNRGYTTYFANGRQGDMANFYTPKALGQAVGTVKELGSRFFTVSGTAAFANGDGLCFFDEQQHLQGFRVNRADKNKLFPLVMPQGLRPGVTLYRSSDQAMERKLTGNTAKRKIPVTMSLRPTPDGFALRIDDGPEVAMPIEHQQARTPQHDNIVRELSKLGDTPYECTAVQLPADFNFFIPASQLSALRRKACLTQGISQKETVAVPLQSSDAISNKAPESLLMQCRYCLRHELGFCLKHGGRRPTWHEPLSLRLSDGRTFILQFDCKRCQMNVLAGSPLNDK